MNYAAFKSGTDIRGFAADGFENEALFMSDEFIKKTALAFVDLLCKKSGKKAEEIKISVGHDSRVSAPRIKNCLLEALTSKIAQVLDCSLASTPAMFMSVVKTDADAAIQITASHHPWERNGLKFFTVSGGLEGEDISAILSAAENEDISFLKPDSSKIKKIDFMSEYAADLRGMIKKGVNAEDFEHPLKGYKIIVDAGNGVGGFYANNVLAPLGADTLGSQFLEPDGMFPNHIPNPENQKAMESGCAATVKSGADLGIIFDTDVDRGGAVDSRGEEINRNRLVAIASAIALEGNPGGTIVTDSITSDGLKTYIEQTLGGKHHRFKRGYKNVINEAVRLNNEGVNCPLAIETSGHAALRENYFLDDGAYLVTKIIIKAAQLRREGKSLDSLIADLKEAKEEKELRFPITAEDFRPYGEGTIAALESYAKSHNWDIAPDNREGIRISFPENDGDGWFLLRMSVHDPILPLNIESNSVGGVRVLAEKLLNFFDEVKPENVDYAALREFLAK